MPAEWEDHEATWIGWPHNASDWPGKFSVIPWVFGEIVRKLSMGERVRILVHSARHEAGARRLLQRVHADLSQVEFFRFPTNRNWTRDFGPMFVQRAGAEPQLAVVNFKFNAWAIAVRASMLPPASKTGACATGSLAFSGRAMEYTVPERHSGLSVDS